jgi:hypothetical protein
MDPELLKRFQHQIWIQCKFALAAYDELGARITQMTQIRSGPDPRYLELAGLPQTSSPPRPSRSPWRTRSTPGRRCRPC